MHRDTIKLSIHWSSKVPKRCKYNAVFLGLLQNKIRSVLLKSNSSKKKLYKEKYNTIDQ